MTAREMVVINDLDKLESQYCVFHGVPSQVSALAGTQLVCLDVLIPFFFCNFETIMTVLNKAFRSQSISCQQSFKVTFYQERKIFLGRHLGFLQCPFTCRDYLNWFT